MGCFTAEVKEPAPWDMIFPDDVALNGETNAETEKRLESNGGMKWKRVMMSRQKTEYLCKGNKEEREVKMQGLNVN